MAWTPHEIVNESNPEPEFVYEDEFDYLFAYTSPNPTREGCPGREILVALSRRALPIGDPRYLHLLKCSPCFRALRAMQQRRRSRELDRVSLVE